MRTTFLLFLILAGEAAVPKVDQHLSFLWTSSHQENHHSGIETAACLGWLCASRLQNRHHDITTLHVETTMHHSSFIHQKHAMHLHHYNQHNKLGKPTNLGEHQTHQDKKFLVSPNPLHGQFKRASVCTFSYMTYLIIT